MVWRVSSLWHRKFLLVMAGICACLYAIGLLCYVPFTPDIGLRCSFSTEIQQVDHEYLASAVPDPPKDPLLLPQEGDILVQVGDYQIETPNRRWAQVQMYRALTKTLDQEDGTPYFQQTKLIPVRYRKSGDSEVRAVDIPVRRMPFVDVIPSLLWFLLKIGLFAVGALVFWKRPEDVSARQFFLLCIVALGAYMGGYHWVRIAAQPLLLLVFMVCGVMLPAVTLHFFLVFPRPKPFIHQHSQATLLAIYGPPVAFLVVLVFGYLEVRRWLPSTPVQTEAFAWSFLRNTILLYLVVGVVWYLASVVALIHSYRTAANSLERNQVKWILVGSLVALVLVCYTFYLIQWEPDDFGAGAGRWPMFAASACFTLAFAFSITRYRLMQLDQLISSGATYFLISFAVGLVYYAVIFVVMLLVGRQFLAGPLAQALAVSSTALALLLVLNLARKQFKKVVDRRFFREKSQLDRTLRRMSQAIEQLVDPPTLARRLLQTSAEMLNVTRGAIFLREGEPPLYRLAGAIGMPPPLTELSNGCPLIEAVQGKGVLTLHAAQAFEPAKRQLRFLGGEIAQPLTHEGQLLAVLVLGAKDLGFYGSEDFNLLTAFSQFTALALESAAEHHTIDVLNRDLQDKVQKISEQQRRILALQSQLLRQSSRDHGLKSDLQGPNSEVPASLKVDGILGTSPAVRDMLDLVRKVSATPTQSAVLIHGESGTGKGLLAQILHDNSVRAGKPFVKVHCAALAPGVLESELFGHVKGAFTGAHRDKVGRFEAADGGTLFLDEIGDISLDVQTKLLRVLQDKTFERVGSNEPIQVDVRIIAATHQDLEELIEQKRFRADLYYRLKVIEIRVPPLRDRREDIPELAQHFLSIFAQKCGKAVHHIDDDALAALKAYPWPGNIRELENILERAVVVADGPAVTLSELPTDLVIAAESQQRLERDDSDATPLPPGIKAERAERDRRERERLVRALAAADGNKAEAARALGLARSTFVSRLSKHGLS